MHPFTVRTNPGGAVTDSPLVFDKTIGAYLEPALAAPAERFFVVAAMTFIRPSSPATGLLFLYHA